MKNITILNVTISTLPAKKPGGKPYQMAEVAFKNNSFNGAVQGKKITSYSKAFTAIAEAQPGETFDVTEEKNGEFVEWVALTKAGAAAPAPQASSTPNSGYTGAKTTAVPARTPYETPEERAARQVYIVRQSGISSAIAALSVGAKSALKPGDIIKLAREFEAYVFDKGSLTGFEDVPDLDPSFHNEPNIA